MTDRFQWATHFNAHAHLRLWRDDNHDGYSFQWATHFNAHAHTLIKQHQPTVSDEFQWATHFNAHAHCNQIIEPTQTHCAEQFQWATHFNAHAHRSINSPNFRQTSEVSMGYSLQRPRARDFASHRHQRTSDCAFQWATHFNAHAHSPKKQQRPAGVCAVSMGYSLQRPRAHKKPNAPTNYNQVRGFNGLLTSTP